MLRVDPEYVNRLATIAQITSTRPLTEEELRREQRTYLAARLPLSPRLYAIEHYVPSAVTQSPVRVALSKGAFT